MTAQTSGGGGPDFIQGGRPPGSPHWRRRFVHDGDQLNLRAWWGGSADMFFQLSYWAAISKFTVQVRTRIL